MGPRGEMSLTPKDKQQGLMVSGFVSREYGFNWKLDDKELKKINEYRTNQEYADRESAINKTGSALKSKLKTSPFQHDLEYGANNEGYWTYENMIIQVEDCIDCLKAINGDKYQYLFLFDHSNGHDRTTEDALKADAICKTYSRKQTTIHDSTILDSSFPGLFTHNTKLKVSKLIGQIISCELKGLLRKKLNTSC